MEISSIDVNEDATVAALLELEHTAHRADCPDRPAPCSVAYPVDLRQPRPGWDVRHRVVREGGRVVGHLTMSLPTLDNLHLAGMAVVVRPDHRRRGIGRALAAAGSAIAREAGRRTVTAGALGTWGDGPARPEAGARFLESLGFTLALTEVARRADLTALDVEVERKRYADAVARSAGYEVIPWVDRVPADLLPGTATLSSTFLAEAPTGELELEAQNIDADRIRALEDASLARGFFVCGVLARHRQSGEVVAHTVIGVPTEPGDAASQWSTLVARGHRGHRLGLRIKLENHRQLRRERPAVRWVYTGNADVNQHMIAINEQLGFTPLDAHLEYQRAL